MNRRELISNSSKAGKQKSNKLLFFLNGQEIGDFFNFQERTHEMIVFQSLDFVEFDRD